jgi:hypothetical protein
MWKVLAKNVHFSRHYHIPPGQTGRLSFSAIVPDKPVPD